FARSCVFSKQSLAPGLCGRPALRGRGPYTPAGPPSPEVTGAFCRVPWPQFTRSPRYSLPDHLCRFGVRAALALARGFSRQHGIAHFATLGSASGLRHEGRGFAYAPPYTLTPGKPPPGLDYPPASPHRLPTTGRGPALPAPGTRGAH